MSKFNSVPIIVQQIGENVRNKTLQAHIRFNYARTVESIRDYCDVILQEWKKEQDKQNKK